MRVRALLLLVLLFIGVQISDARDEVVKAYKGIADLRAQDSLDIGRQRMLAQSMTKYSAVLPADECSGSV